MAGTIVRIFDDATQAITAAERIEAAGVRHSDISLIANNSEGWYEVEKSKRSMRAARNDRDADGKDDRAEAAVEGAGAGGLIGAGAGLLAGLGMLAIPGLGPVVAAGWLASTATGAAVGAVAGGLVGGLVGALTREGVDREDAEVYAESVRRGGALLLVRNADKNRTEVDRALRDFKTADADMRRDYYRNSGWTGYDPNAPELTPAEIEAERARRASYQPPPPPGPRPA